MVSLNLEKKQIDLINESLCVYATCNECMELHRTGNLGFSRVDGFVDDRGKSCLYRLKQMCHDLFRNADEAGYKEKFYDITVGYIFHEAMKLRENLYQLEYYKPQYAQLNNTDGLTASEKKILHEFDVHINKAEKRLNDELKQVKIILRELVAQLKDLIKLYRNNYLLPRFLLDNEKSFTRIYGARGYRELLGEMYEKGKATLLSRAALSYLESQYYEMAAHLFRKVMALDTHDERAHFFFLYSSAFNLYFKNRLSRALGYANRAASTAAAGDDVERYRQELENLISELPKEMSRRRKR